jgi:hypothetical protein
MAVDEFELDVLAETGEQRRPVTGKDRLHKLSERLRQHTPRLSFLSEGV